MYTAHEKEADNGKPALLGSPTRTPLARLFCHYPADVTLRAVTAVAIAGALLALVAGCGAKNASSPSDVELVYSVTPEGGARGAGIFLVDREGKHRRRLLTRVPMPDAQDVYWSPTSDLLLFHSLSGEIWTIRSDGSDLTKIAVDGRASWSPDGKMIAVGRGDAVDILSTDGELQRRISPREGDGSIFSAPSWSPDGMKVAFATASDKYHAIFVAPVREEGGAVLLVKDVNEAYPTTGRETEFETPSWSPDGELLAFESTEFEVPSIWTMRADGSHRKRIAENASLFGWAAGGRSVLCAGVEERGRLGSLHECPLDGGSWRLLAPGEEKRAEPPRGQRNRSPDGRQLATTTLSGSIVVSRADGSEPRVLTDAGTDDLPEWSPDGSRLTFVREAVADDSISWVYVVGRDGKGARRLVRGNFASWLPDGADLLVGRMPNIFVVTLEGETRRLARGWGPGGGFSAPAVLAPDGAMVAYLRTGAAAKNGAFTEAIHVIGTRGGQERKVLDVSNGEVSDLAWSSDGKRLLLLGWLFSDNDEYPTLYEVSLSGTTRPLATGVTEAGLTVSPQGDEVAFVSNTGETLEALDLETGKRRLLVRTGPRDESLLDAFEDPQWSPDGSTLAYVTTLYGDTVYALETVRADGSTKMRVSAPGEDVGSFSWRPSGASG